MPVPASWAITLGKIGNEVRSTNSSNDYNDGPYTAGATGLWQAENGVYGGINQHNPGANMPNRAQPSTFSEWYSYDHHYPS